MSSRIQIETILPAEVLENISPPREASRLILQKSDIKSGEGKKGFRRIFDGNTQFDHFEFGELQEMRNYIAKNRQTLPPDWNDARILKFLQANNFKLNKTLDAICQHIDWRAHYLPPKYTYQVSAFLKEGIFYLQGRDNDMRPIVVCRADLIDMEKMTVEQLIEGIIFFYEFLIEVALYPGKIENWVMLLDLNGRGLTSLPISALKKMLDVLSNNFRSRLYCMYVLNTPSSIYFPWKVVKAMLEESTIEKIKFANGPVPHELFKKTSYEQIEKKYGGTYPNRGPGDFWPPKIAPLDLKNVNLAPPEPLTGTENGIASPQKFLLQQYLMTNALFPQNQMRIVQQPVVVEPNPTSHLSHVASQMQVQPKPQPQLSAQHHSKSSFDIHSPECNIPMQHIDEKSNIKCVPSEREINASGHRFRF